MRLLNYDTYNESIRDKMLPISKDEVRSKFDKFHPVDAIIKGIQNNLPWLVDEMIQYMISKHGKEETSKILQNLGPYHLEKAMETNNLEILEILLKAGYKIDLGKMRWAVVCGSLEAVKMLVKYGGVVDKQLIDHCIKYRPNIFGDRDSRKAEVMNFLKRTYGLGNRIKDVLRMDESVKDMMTPKPKEDIDKVVDKIFSDNPDLKVFDWKKFGFQLISHQHLPTLYTFKFLAPDDSVWYLHMWKNGSIDIRKINGEVGQFKTNTELEKYLEDKFKTNESVRDKMTPKSGDEISSVLKDRSQWKQFKIACENGMLDLLKRLLKEDDNDDIHDVIQLGIDIARRKGQSEIVDFLMNYKQSGKYQRKYMLGESIRDKMTPKPEESIKVSLRDYFDERRKVKHPTKSIIDLGFLDIDNLYFVNDENKYYEEIDDYISQLTRSHKGEVLKFSDKEYTIYPETGIVRYWNKGALEGIYFDGKHVDGMIEYISNDKLSESIRDKMTPKKGAIEKIEIAYMDLSKWLVDDKIFDTQEDAMEFLKDEGISDNIENMLGLGMDLDEVYDEITQFNLDEYLYDKGLPLKFAFEPKIKDDPNIVGSDAYNREHHMFYYETPESKKIKDQRREQIRKRLNLD